MDLDSRTIRYRDLTTLSDYRAVVELERVVWGFDPEDVVPVPILVITVKRGGILIGAFDAADEMVGFVYSLSGLKHGRPMHWSHMLGIVDRHRNAGLGYALKQRQRRRALDLGLDLVEWTFDPLQALNAHFNFRKLGVVVEEYERNLYGESSSPLHRGNPTDRLVAQWWIASAEVVQRLERGSGAAGETPAGDAIAVNGVVPAGPWLACTAVDLARSEPHLAVEIPTGFSDMLVEEPSLARAWRMATREIFTSYLARGYRVRDFTLDRPARRGRYLLTRDAPP